jgi:uncharacterized membrane protein SirB2
MLNNIDFTFLNDYQGDALTSLNVSENLGEDFVPFIDDTLRMVTLQIIIQFMFFLRDNKENPFFCESFFELLFYIILGLMFYWLIIRKIINIE